MVIVPSTGSAQTPVMPPLSSVSAFVTFTDAAPTENICQQTNGDHYVTMLDTKKVVKISPDGRITDFVIIPDAMFVIGVACGSNEIAVSIFTKDYRKPAGGLVFTDTGARLKFYDLAGKPKADVAAPANVAINGFDYAGDGIYCGGDSNSGTVFRIDSATHSLTPWFKDESLAPTPKQAIGLYGVRAKNGWVYFSGPSKSGLFKVKIGANGQPEGGAIPMEPGLCVDDFDVADDGSTYFANGGILFKVSADGVVTPVADPIPWGPSAVVSNDDKTLYWPTRGGSAPQRTSRPSFPRGLFANDQEKVGAIAPLAAQM